jgi:hypothetical protein
MAHSLALKLLKFERYALYEVFQPVCSAYLDSQLAERYSMISGDLDTAFAISRAPVLRTAAPRLIKKSTRLIHSSGE